jgi:hypothetical protein
MLVKADAAALKQVRQLFPDRPRVAEVYSVQSMFAHKTETQQSRSQNGSGFVLSYPELFYDLFKRVLRVLSALLVRAARDFSPAGAPG